MLVSKEKCIGCLLCAAICPHNAITKDVDELGFIYPQINAELCVSCNLCEQNCPQVTPVLASEPISSYYGQNGDRKILPFCSSGGIFQCIVKNHEGQIVIGSSLKESNGYAKHILVDLSSDNKNRIRELYGSKYVQSELSVDLFYNIIDNLKNGKKVLFSGTPCQCAAIKRYVDYCRIDDTNLFLCEIMCHGVPAPMLFRKWYNFLNKDRRVENINFRSKKYGWLDASYSIKYSTDDVESIPVESCEYHYYFGLHYSIKEACFHCRYRNIKRVSDVTIGDYWGIRQFRTKLGIKQIQQGVSTILVNTKKGERLVESIKRSASLIPITLKEALQNNEVQLHNFEIPSGRADFLDFVKHNDWEEIIKQYPAVDRKKATLKVFGRKAKRIANYFFIKRI